MSGILTWDFEAFREYVSYQTLMAAAAVLFQFEGEFVSSSNPRIQQMEKLLALRTNKHTWIPNRTGSLDVDWNVEGGFYRNKGRVLTSMLILEPKDAYAPPIVKLLPFGQALARGKISESEFYDFIITRFRYPHPAWEKNWNAWNAAGKTLYPFAYLLQVLIALNEISPEAAFLTTKEVASYLYPRSEHAQVKNVAQAVFDSRLTSSPNQENPVVDPRKFTDILGFLCISGYCYYIPSGGITKIGLNLRYRHSKEFSMFEHRRKPKDHPLEDRLETIKNLVRSIPRL